MSFGLPLRNGVSVAATSTVAMGSWSRTSVNDFRAAMPTGSTYTRAGSATALTVAGAIQTFATDAPQRTDRGLALEPAATNPLLWSQTFDDAVWDKGTGGSIAANTIVAPDGTTTADEYTWPSGTGNFALLCQSVVGDASTAKTFSIYLKIPAGTKTFRQRISNVLLATRSSDTKTLTTSWQRFDMVLAAADIANTGLIGVGLSDGLSGVSLTTGDIVHVWQTDLIDGSVGQSPIVTTSTSASRSLPVFTEPVPAGRTKALLTYADASTTLVTGLTPGGTFDAATTVIAANKGRFGASELVTRVWYP